MIKIGAKYCRFDAENILAKRRIILKMIYVQALEFKTNLLKFFKDNKIIDNLSYSLILDI